MGIGYLSTKGERCFTQSAPARQLSRSCRSSIGKLDSFGPSFSKICITLYLYMTASEMPLFQASEKGSDRGVVSYPKRNFGIVENNDYESMCKGEKRKKVLLTIKHQTRRIGSKVWTVAKTNVTLQYSFLSSELMKVGLECRLQ